MKALYRLRDFLKGKCLITYLLFLFVGTFEVTLLLYGMIKICQIDYDFYELFYPLWSASVLVVSILSAFFASDFQESFKK
jgi:hypothetical protein